MRTAIKNIGLGGVVVIGLGVLALALGGCSGSKLTPEETLQGASQELRQSVTSNVLDPGRRDQMLTLVDQIESTQRDFSAQAVEFADKYRKLNANYDAARVQFEELFADFQSRRTRARDRILDLHFRFAALATAEEWARIGKVEARLYEEVEVARTEQAGAT